MTRFILAEISPENTTLWLASWKTPAGILVLLVGIASMIKGQLRSSVTQVVLSGIVMAIILSVLIDPGILRVRLPG